MENKRVKVRIIVLIAVAASLILAAGVLAQTTGRYFVEEPTTAGGGYQLTSLCWQVNGTASGGGYRLLGPAAQAQRGSGCCCTYLPIGLRNRP